MKKTTLVRMMIGNDTGMNMMSNPNSILEACSPDQQARLRTR